MSTQPTPATWPPAQIRSFSMACPGRPAAMNANRQASLSSSPGRKIASGTIASATAAPYSGRAASSRAQPTSPITSESPVDCRAPSRCSSAPTWLNRTSRGSDTTVREKPRMIM